MNENQITGTYPFGSKLKPLVQLDRSPKRIFILGVYASAVHALWIGPDGRTLVRALAVASEPVIFWDGAGADEILRAVSVPAVAGRLAPADPKFNGPSGRSMDDDFLAPLGLTRKDTWLCDLVPHTCLNAGQLAAILREYEPRRKACGLPGVDLPAVPRSFADAERRVEGSPRSRRRSPRSSRSSETNPSATSPPSTIDGKVLRSSGRMTPATGAFTQSPSGAGTTNFFRWPTRGR
jgi:hypothetical protein